jgi:hypothetical protein
LRTRIPYQLLSQIRDYLILDGGEKDDKLIAVTRNIPLYQVNGIEELDQAYAGISAIIEN